MKYVIKETITIKEYLKALNLSKALICRIKSNGDFLVNGQHQTVRYLLQPQDILEIILPQETSSIIPNDIELNIVYEDQHYLIIDKPSNLPVIPTKRYPDHTLSNGIINYYQKNNIHATVHLVNRLDKDTQGLMLVAKDSYSHYLLSRNIKQVKRVYLCLVDGIMQGQGTINQPIIKDKDSVKRLVDDNGKPSITHYQVIKQLDNQTLVKCILETGRTHQIRVHLAYLNHPLSGDNLYGSKTNCDIYLDSVELAFINPYTKKKIEIKKR